MFLYFICRKGHLHLKPLKLEMHSHILLLWFQGEDDEDIGQQFFVSVEGEMMLETNSLCLLYLAVWRLTTFSTSPTMRKPGISGNLSRRRSLESHRSPPRNILQLLAIFLASPVLPAKVRMTLMSKVEQFFELNPPEFAA